MIIPPRLRMTALVVHLAYSVGWLGAVAGFLVLAITARATADEWVMRPAHSSMKVIASAALISLSIASLLSGLVSSLGTPWGWAHDLVRKSFTPVGPTRIVAVHVVSAAGSAPGSGVAALSVPLQVTAAGTAVVPVLKGKVADVSGNAFMAPRRTRSASPLHPPRRQQTPSTLPHHHQRIDPWDQRRGGL